MYQKTIIETADELLDCIRHHRKAGDQTPTLTDPTMFKKLFSKDKEPEPNHKTKD